MESRVSAGFCMAREFARIPRDGPFKTFGKTMLKPLTGATSSTLRRVALHDLGAVRVQGADVIKFLQGQLSNDVTKLTAGHSLLAGFHNAQGRAIALLRLVLVGPDEVLALLPRELAAPVAARISKFVLRAKVKVTDASADFAIEGVLAGEAGEWTGATVGDARSDSDGAHCVYVGLSTIRWLAVRPAASPSNLSTSEIDREAWRALDIADGIPQVYAATSEAFVAQMLNLDVLGGISFEKGCYTGQEVIARAHYRGKVKRRLQRFVTSSAALAPGASGVLPDGRAFKVVDAARNAEGQTEFLAVAPLSGGNDEAPVSEVDAGATAIEAKGLELPYALP